MAQGIFNLKQVNQAVRQGAWSGTYAPTFVEYLVVAGGGGGAINRGGGGGAGGLLNGIVAVTPGASYTVIVGGGGAGKSPNGQGNNGSDSVFGNLTTTGGGGGGDNTGSIGSAGGSGGGSGNSGTNYGGQATVGQGNAGGGGYYVGSNYGGGGGGGAGSIGGTGTGVLPGNGGQGIASDISGTRTVYAGGGGGEGQTIEGLGGDGGGGKGNGATALKNGTPNTGGGGGGGGGPSGGGGSGIVIVRYPGSIQFYTGGAVTYANGHVVHTFYVTDTLTPTTPTAIATSEYQISRSLRFNSADSAYLNRTPASAGNQKTWTLSFWVKRANLGGSAEQMMYSASNGSGTDSLYFNYAADDSISIYLWNATVGSLTFVGRTTAVFRDPSAWYHMVLAVDTTQATGADRVKFYVNNVLQAISTYTAPAQNSDCSTNSTGAHYLGRFSSALYYLNGYMTEVNFVNAQQLTPSSFGETNSNTGVWQPKAYTGTYGTNGFYLNFSDNSNTTAATLGKDYSGNGNNWTPNSFSVSAGVGNDSLLDTPTPYGTDTGLGGTVRGNYCTLNPLIYRYGYPTITTFSNGNLDALMTSAAVGSYIFGSIFVSSGKWYWETTINAIGAVGGGTGIDDGSKAYDLSTGSYYYYSNGSKASSASLIAYGASYTTNDIIGTAFDADAGTLTFYKNNTSQGVAFTGITGQKGYLGIGENGFSISTNFGQRPFAYTAPSGFKALCTQNLPTPTIGASPTSLASKFFNTVLWTGNGSQTRSITGVGFQPDFTWMKIRADTAQDHQLYDAVRGAGAGKNLSSNTTAAEGTVNSYLDSDYGYLSSFDSDGFSVNDGAVATTGGYVNYSARTYVAWNWKASNATAVTNTSGSLTSSVRANPTAGFSVVTYTGNAGSGQTIGHGLNVAPSMIIVGARGGGNWPVYHKAGGINQYVFLNSTAALNTVTGYWGTAVPTPTVFGVIGGGYNNNSGTAVAYCFAEVEGYSKFGSYTGNGSTDGPFSYTGFKPAFIMIKIASGNVGDWCMYDTSRSPYNVVDIQLFADTSQTESTIGSGNFLDILSNGFKNRNTATDKNGSGYTYIYMAFASNPFKYSLAR